MPAPWHSSRAPALACAAVHEDRLIRKVNGHFHGLQPVGSNIHQAAQIFKEADRDSPVDGVVFGQRTWRARLENVRVLTLAARLSLRHGKANVSTNSDPLAGSLVQRASHKFGQPARDGQAQSGAFLLASHRRIDPAEIGKQPRQILGGDSDSRVLYRNLKGHRPSTCSEDSMRSATEPLSVNLKALSSRFSTIWRTRPVSPNTRRPATQE
jgi:hypothetical protein